MRHYRAMENKVTFTQFTRDTRSIAEACLAADRAERDARRAARQSGAEFTNWVISDRD